MLRRSTVLTFVLLLMFALRHFLVKLKASLCYIIYQKIIVLN